MEQSPGKSGISKAKEKSINFCKEHRTLFFCCLLSVVSHTPLLTTENQIQTVSELLGQTHVMRERIEMFFKQSFREDFKAEYLAQLKGQPVDKVKLGNFFLKTEFNEGVTDDDEVKEGQKKFNQLIQFFKTLAIKEKDELNVLRELVKKQGTHEEGESSLRSILVDGTGNCEARAKLAISVLQETYPDMPVKLQHYRDHIRAIAHVNGKWYALEGKGPSPVEKKDFQNTIVTDPSAFVSSYTGKNYGVNRIGLKPNPKRAKARITNTYFNLLSGADNSKLIDVSDARARKTNRKIQAPLLDPKKAQAAINIPTFGKSRGKRPDKQRNAPIRIEVFTEKEMEKLFNKEKKKKRAQKPFKWTEEIITEAKQTQSFKSRYTDLTDLGPLKGVSLKDIDIRGTNVSDLSPLEGAPIEHINLNNTEIADLSPLKDMPLKSIWLAETNVTDLSPLKENKFLKVIDLSGTDVSDLTPLGGATSLARIDLDSTKVTDLSPLSGIPVRFIDISNTEVADLSPLRETLTLKDIFLKNTNVVDLSPLKMISIENIDLSHSNVSDLSPLMGMPITNINLSHTDVFDLSPLQGMLLKEIALSHTDVSDLSPLKFRRIPLNRINLSHTNVTDLSPLKDMPLRHIDTSSTNVSDLSPLFGSNFIYSLNIKKTKVEDITFLKKRRVNQFSSDFSRQEVFKYRIEYSKSRRAIKRRR